MTDLLKEYKDLQQDFDALNSKYNVLRKTCIKNLYKTTLLKEQNKRLLEQNKKMATTLISWNKTESF